MLRLRHFDEMNMFNFPASACSDFKLYLQLPLYAGSVLGRKNPAQMQHRCSCKRSFTTMMRTDIGAELRDAHYVVRTIWIWNYI
jgi:hypothetical protein